LCRALGLKPALRRKEKPAMSNRVLVLQDIVKALSHETDTSEALCQSFIKELFAIVAERLMDGESVTLKGVGRFDVDGGEVRFVADPDTAAAINSAFDCFEAIELADDFDGDEPVAEDETPDAAEEEAATTADETAGTEDVADENPADGAEPEEKESQTDGLEESGADSEEEKEEDTAETDADNETVAEETAEEETEETAEEAEETVEEEYDDEPQPKRGGCRFAWGFLAGFVTAAVVAAVAWFCLFGVVKKPSSQPAVIADDTAKVAAADSDSTAAVEKPQEQSEEKTAEPEKESKKAEQTFKVTNTAYLSNISRKFYGHYAFWVYIYLDNKDIITDPDNLPVGAKLRIPAPEKYGIDKNNPESIRRAEIKALEIKNGK
jgi:nucleoid-associated protein YgaU/nucleoid DNA-binding protein